MKLIALLFTCSVYIACTDNNNIVNSDSNDSTNHATTITDSNAIVFKSYPIDAVRIFTYDLAIASDKLLYKINNRLGCINDKAVFLSDTVNVNYAFEGDQLLLRGMTPGCILRLEGGASGTLMGKWTIVSATDLKGSIDVDCGVDKSVVRSYTFNEKTITIAVTNVKYCSAAYVNFLNDDYFEEFQYEYWTRAQTPDEYEACKERLKITEALDHHIK